jgi:hypothetical protein
MSASGPLEISTPPRSERLYPEKCTVSAHINGRGGEAADDDASGCAVLELARVLGMFDVRTSRR